jgi:hypothetical protein
MDGQPGWRFCDKCFGIFFNGDPVNKGHCPAEGSHRAQGFVYYLLHDVPATAGQPGWRFCDKCFGMFFANLPPVNQGRCPADGRVHEAQGFLFVLPHDVPETAGQPGWRFCEKCFGMFFNGDPVNKGRCPLDGQLHVAQGFPFVLPHRLFPQPSISVTRSADRRHVDVSGSSFEPDQRVDITFLFKDGSSPSSTSQGTESVVSDSDGRISHRFDPHTTDPAKFSAISAFDFGSGEVATGGFDLPT